MTGRIIWSTPPTAVSYTVWRGRRNGSASGKSYRKKRDAIREAKRLARPGHDVDIWVEEREERR